MDIRFDSDSAISLLKSMSEYCIAIQREAKETISLAQAAGFWNDSKHERFRDYIETISMDLEGILKRQSEYMNLYKDRIEELRGTL